MKKMLSKILLLFYLINAYPLQAQIITTVAGGATGHGGYWGDGGPATAAQLQIFGGLAVDRIGNIYVADANNLRIRRVDATTGIITTVAGTGIAGYNGDGISATSAQINNMAGLVVVDSIGNFYIGDANNYRIRKVDISTGIITTFAGNGTAGFSGDNGPATAAACDFGSFTFDVFGNMIITTNDYRIRKIDPFGIITTIAGIGVTGNSGDGGPATTATMTPNGYGICTDVYGNIYFSDSFMSIRKINVSNGIITRVAGTGNHMGYPYSGDGGPATAAHTTPIAVAVDEIGNLFIVDGPSSRIEKIDTLGIITSIVGTGTHGYSGDNGPATSAEINYPENVVLDKCGNVYIADFNNARVRKVTYPPILTTPIINISGTPSAAIGATVTITATVSNAGSSYIIHWLNKGIEFTTTTVPSVTYTKAAGIDTITARVVPTSNGCWDSTTSAGYVVSVSEEGITSLAAAGRLGEVTIYPNPVNDMLHIDAITQPGSYRILNIVGSLFKQGILKQGGNNIPVQSLPAGVYMIEVTDGAGEKTIKKILKQ